MEKLRVVFMGTPEFAAHHLKVLFDSGAHIVAVITAPDKPAGRGRKLSAPAVKTTALELGLPVLQPEKLKHPDFLAELQSYQPDIQVVVAFRMLPEVVWNLPKYGTFNMHASLLPQYRGAAPINWALINGESSTGVSTFFLSHEIDTGHLIFQEEVPIAPEDNAGSLHDKLMTAGARLVVKTLAAIANGKVQAIPQTDPGDLKPAPKIFKDDCRLDWTDSAVNIHNKIRGLSPYPGAWTLLQSEDKEALNLKIFETEVLEGWEQLAPGQIHCDGKNTFIAGTGQGALLLKEVQPAGKKRMPINSFLCGFNCLPQNLLQ